MKVINFAILGCGKIGLRHADKMRSTEGIKLVAVCDIIPERAKNLGDTHKCCYYTSLSEMLKEEKIDFINICTPSGFHAKHSIECL